MKQAVLDHLVDLAEHVGHDRDVPVRDVGTEHRVEACAERVGLRVERGDGHGVVGLAPAVERRHEQVLDLLDAFDAARRELVEQDAVLLGVDRRLRRHARPIAAVPLEQRRELGPVDALGVEAAHGLPVALLPVADEVGVERRGPRHAAFEEAEVEVGEAPGDAAEEERLGQRVVALAEHADVVVDVARDRAAGLPSHRRGVERRGDARAHGTSARPGRSRGRCRDRRCRSTPRTARARGRGRRPPRSGAARSRPSRPPGSRATPRAPARRPPRRGCASGSRPPGAAGRRTRRTPRR